MSRFSTPYYQKLEVVESFGDRISPNGGCEVSTIARIRSAWRKFRELLPLLTNQAIPMKSRAKVYNSCICSVMLYGSGCWALVTADVQRLQRNERALFRWICKVKIRDKISSDSFLNKLFKEPGYNITNKPFMLVWLCFSQGRLDKEMHTAWSG